MFRLFSWSKQTLSDDNPVVLNSDFFDQDFYSASVGRKFNSRSEAVEHYIQKGESEGRLPSKRFSPGQYSRMYSDVVESGRCLLAHYIEYGLKEGRVPVVDIAELEVRGKREFVPGRPSIALVCHDFSETGAPILGWNIAKNIPDRWNVVSIGLRGGPLKSSFVEVSSAVFDLDELQLYSMITDTVADLVLKPISERFNVSHLVANSAMTYPIAAAATYNGMPVTMLIHEFAEYLAPEQIRTAVVMSDHVVFSSELTRDSAKETTRLSLSNSSVFAQGKSEIPPVKSKSDGRHKLRQFLSSLEDGKFLVIGCGYFQIRKGIDAFVSIAKNVADSLGHENVSFVWVGNGYNPSSDFTYSIWIRDQIKRSGLSDTLHIIPGLDGSDLDQLYRRANTMLLSSRLDPYPNVAIDAISIGLPVVCFAGATGVAEHLLELEDGQCLVAPYLDIREAANRIIEIYHNEELRARLKQQLRDLAGDRFSMKAYVDRILDTMPVASDAALRSVANTNSVLDSGVVSAEFLIPPGSKHNMRSTITDYVRAEERATVSYFPCKRRLFPGYSIEEYSSLLVEANSIVPPTVKWLLAGQPPGPWVREVVDLSLYQVKDGHKLKSAIHIHAHYVDVLETLLGEIAGNNSRPDLFISTSKLSDVPKIEQLISSYQGVASVFHVENRGRDLGPLLVHLAHTLQSYDVVGHLHTKKSLDVSDRKLIETWINFLVANTIGSPNRALDKILSLYAANPRIGLSFPEDPNLVGWTENRDIASGLLFDLGINKPIQNNIEFPVGNFFFFRPQAIGTLLKRGFQLKDFPEEPVPYDGTVLHALERIWTIVCEHEGYDWITTTVRGVNR